MSDEERPPDVPSDCIAIYFEADNHKAGTYYIWKRTFKRTGIIQWCWKALGHDGVEPTAFEATQSARNWIRDGVSTLGIVAKSNSNKHSST